MCARVWLGVSGLVSLAVNVRLCISERIRVFVCVRVHLNREAAVGGGW